MPRISKATARIFGIPPESLQTILIPDTVSLEDAKNWLRGHDFNYNKHRSTKNFRRFMQVNPITGAQFYTKRLPNGVEFVFQKY